MSEAELFDRPEAIELGRLRFVPLAAEHFFDLELQDSQRTQYGLDPTAISRDEAEHYARQPNCWAVLRCDRPIAILGISETFAGVQGVAFALLGKDLGRDHLSLTRFLRDVVIGQSELTRIEAIVRCRDIEPHLTGFYSLDRADPGDLLDLALEEPTPQVRWAKMAGLSPVAVLRKFGAAAETHMLMERVR